MTNKVKRLSIFLLLLLFMALLFASVFVIGNRTETANADSYVRELSEGHAHNYVASTVAATCTTDGYTVYTCTVCGDNYRGNQTSKLGHNYVHSQVAPTCTDSGYTQYTCTRCNFEYKTVNAQPLGHNFVTYTEYANCTEYGKIVNECKVCGYKESKPDGTYPFGHDYTETIVKQATCTKEGIRGFTCDICGDHYEEVIHAQGHSYHITDIKSKNGNTTRTYTCSLCGSSYKQDIGDQYEQVANYIEYLFDEYSPYMIWVFLATAGVWSIAIGIAIIIAQKNEDKEKARKMLINYVVGLVVVFAIFVAAPYLVRGIAVLVT